MKINDFRQKYPEYNDLTDFQVTSALHKRYVSQSGDDIPITDFAQEFGVSIQTQDLALPDQQNINTGLNRQNPDQLISDVNQKLQAPVTPQIQRSAQPLIDESQAETSVPYNQAEQGLLSEFSQLQQQDNAQSVEQPPYTGLDQRNGSTTSLIADIESKVGKKTRDSFWQAMSKSVRNLPSDFKSAFAGAQMSGLEGELESELKFQEGYNYQSKAGKEYQRQIINSLKKRIEQAKADRKNAIAEKEPINVEPQSPEYYASSAVTSIGLMGPALLGGILTRNPAVTLSMMAPQSKGEAFGRARIDKGLSREEAENYANATAAAEVIPELLPVSTLLKPGYKIFERAIKSTAAEVAQELTTEALQIGIDKQVINPNMTWGEARQRLIDAGVLAVIAGPAQTAIAHPLVKAVDKVAGPEATLGKEMQKNVEQAEPVFSAEDIAIDQLKPDQPQPLPRIKKEETQPPPTGDYVQKDFTPSDSAEVTLNEPPKQEIDVAAHEAATSPTNDIPQPTDAQKEAGNYKKGHITLNGLDIAIENPKGSERTGTDSDGETWLVTMKNHYGYIKRSNGADGDNVDVFLGDKANDPETPVFIVNQVDPKTKAFDEHKVMMGFDNVTQARKAYQANYAKGWKGNGGMVKMTQDEFKRWVKDGDTSKPAVKPVVRKSRITRNRENKSTDIISNVPENFKGKKIFHGRGEVSPGILSAKVDVPIAGKGSYYAFSKENASRYGSDISTEKIENIIRNPLVISDDNQWRKLTRSAGWDVPNPYGKPNSELTRITENLKKEVIKQGHDGVIIDFDETTPYDIDEKTGASIKLLRDVFDSPQVISYKSPAKSVKEEKTKYDSELSMDKESRLQRAREQGFDTENTWVHATNADDIKAFDKNKRGDQTLSNASDNSYGMTSLIGEYFNRGSEDLISKGFNTVMYPVLLPKTDDLYDVGSLRSLANDLAYTAEQMGVDINNVDDLYYDLKPVADEYVKDLEDQGYKGVIFEDEEFGGTSVAIFNPKNIRSINATFDPSKTESSNLLEEQKPPYKTRPSINATQAKNGKQALKEAAQYNSTLGNAINKHLLKNKTVSLIGLKIDGVHSLAELVQQFRNPKFETLYYIFSKDGVITGMETVSQRLPGSSAAFPAKVQKAKDDVVRDSWIFKRALKYGADSVYLTHNHPSGRSQPSFSDINFTNNVKNIFTSATYGKGEAPIKFQGHIIIDHNEYTVIDPLKVSQGTEIETYTINNTKQDPERLKPHDVLGTPISEPSHLVDVAKRIEKKDGYVILISQGSKGDVKGIMLSPAKYYSQENNKRALASIRSFGRNTGGSSMFVSAEDGKMEDYKWLIENGYARDVLHKGDSIMMTMGVYDRSPSGGMAGLTKTLHEVFEDKPSYKTQYKLDKKLSAKALAYQGKLKTKPLSQKLTDRTPEQFNSKALIYSAPGQNYQPLYQSSDTEGFERPPSGYVDLGDRKVLIPTHEKPQNRESIRVALVNIIGTRLYEGKVRGKTRLGFYNRKTGEVRVKRYGAVEVMAHEMAHYLDFHSNVKDQFRKLYSDKRYAGEVKALSYTDEAEIQMSEGFAEFVRLWLTRYPEAKLNAPKFTAAFEALLKKNKKLSKQMRILQGKMHKWYYQGSLARLRAIRDGNNLTNREWVDTVIHKRPLEVMRQKAVDHIHAAKVLEREVYGGLQDATKSAYKELQLINGVEGIFTEMTKKGAPRFNEEGAIEFYGPSLEDVFRKSILAGTEVFAKIQDYFVARRAQELKSQGRENLIDQGMIDAGLRHAIRYPYFEKAFADYQQYRKNLMEFMVQTGYIERSAAKAMLKKNKNYVPFNRVVEGIGESFAGAGNFQRLKGGTQNIQNVYDNIVQGDFQHLKAALQARALRTMFEAGLKSDNGSPFFSRISPDSKRVKTQSDQMAIKVARAMAEFDITITKDGQLVSGDIDAKKVDIDEINNYFQKNPEELMFWTFGHMPKTSETMVTSFIDRKSGKRQWIEISKEGELMTDMLDNLNGWALPPGIFGSVIKGFYGIKNLQTVLITSMPQFSIPNLVRDTQTAMIISGGAFKPVYHNMLGFASMLGHAMGRNTLYSEMLANGGGWAGRARSAIDETAGRQHHEMPGHWFSPKLFLRNVLNAYVRIIDSPEMSTRVGFYIQQRKSGKSARESAWGTREISTDFRKHGSYAPLVMLQRTIPFHGAFVQSVDRDIRAFAEKDGEIKFSNLLKTESGRIHLGDLKIRMGIVAGSFATIALILAGMNEDDDWYKDLTADERVRFFHVKIGGERYQIPKPHGFFSMILQGVETLKDYIHDKEGADASKVLMYSIAYNLNDSIYPGAINPWVEISKNENFAGSPIVPEFMKASSSEMEFTESTPQLYVEIGEKLGISPLQARHVSRGYLGYLENFISDAVEIALWDEEKWGERPFKSGVKQYFGKQFLPREVPYRTRWIEKYYELRGKVETAKADLAQAKKWLPFKTNRMAAVLEDKANNYLAGLDKAFKQADDAASSLRSQSILIMYDSSLSGPQKEQQINAARREKNKIFKVYYNEIKQVVKELEKQTDKIKRGRGKLNKQ